MLTGLLDQLIQYTDWLILLAAKATVLLSLAFVGTRLLRNQSARLHHALWSVTFFALALLPIMEGVLPPVEIPGVTWPGLPAASVQRADAATVPDGAVVEAGVRDGRDAAAGEAAPAASANRLEGLRGTVGVAGRAVDATAPAGTHGVLARLRETGSWAVATLVRPAAAAAGAIWLLGFGAMLLLLGLALVRARRIAWRAPIVRHHGWRRDCELWCRRLGLRRVVSLRVTDEVTTPMAGGVLAPFVLLPRAALEWPAARREVVLQHELLHLRGLDPLRALAARCAAAIYWFHPLVWIAGREAVLARESACDEQVVALGTRPSLYASVLLELADASGRTPIPAAVLPMIQRSLLETRLMSILKRDRPGGGRRLTIVAVALMSLVALSVAVAAPQEQDPPKPVKPPKPPVVEPVLAEEPIEPVLAEQSVVPDLPPLPALGKLAPLPPLDAEPMPALAPFAEPMPSELPYGEPMPALAPFAESMPTPGIAATPALAPQASGVWTVPESEPAVAPVPGVWSVPAPRAALAPLPEPPACAWDGSGGLSYNGSMSMTSTGGYRVIEGIGKADGNLMMKKVVDGVTLCLQTRGDVEFTEDMTGIQRIGDGGSVLLATVGEDREQAMEITGTAPTDHQWAIDGQPTPFDEEARVWRDSLLEVLGRFWEISTIRGEVSSLRGEASSLRGHMSSLRGEASALRGEASGLRGKASSLRGERSALQGEISAIRGQLSAMRGEVSSHQGEISALTAERSRASETEFESIEAQIAEHRQAIEILAAEIEEVDVEARVEAVERQIEALEFESRVEEYEAQAEQLQTGERMEQLQEEMEAFQLESELRMQEIQVQIEGLNAEERIGALQQELELHLQQLQLARERTR